MSLKFVFEWKAFLTYQHNMTDAPVLSYSDGCAAEDTYLTFVLTFAFWIFHNTFESFAMCGQLESRKKIIKWSSL